MHQLGELAANMGVIQSIYVGGEESGGSLKGKKKGKPPSLFVCRGVGKQLPCSTFIPFCVSWCTYEKKNVHIMNHPQSSKTIYNSSLVKK